MLAAGFMFGSGLVLNEVPFDPELPFLFDGEEVCFLLIELTWELHYALSLLCLPVAQRTFRQLPLETAQHYSSHAQYA